MKRATKSGKDPVSFRRGLLVSAIEVANLALKTADRQRDILSPADRELLRTSMEVLLGIEQRTWV